VDRLKQGWALHDDVSSRYAACDAVLVEDVPHGRVRAIRQFRDFSQGSTCGVLLQDEALDSTLDR
jgi:hypothetical protein